MWIGDKVKVLEPKKAKRNKIKLKPIGKSTITKHIGQVGLSDETSEFVVELDNGRSVEVTEDFLQPIDS